ncbi:MAG: NeuD/PglB/VioB family sugar acetyltransferase [Bacteroidia bacterium]|nr:NeuD/PglB/VioB family sugar acetyltransferase [Bacteroidia bacterium]MDW8135108.1 NeuD/PglB/VioB family sugar acetyltransferase [Bacteroidia bacterium]
MILYGGGDHALGLWEICQLRGIVVKGFFDDGEGPFALPKEAHLGAYDPTIYPEEPIIVAITDNTIRRNLSLRIKHPIAPPLVHPHAYVAPSATLENGVVVLAGAVIHSQSYIGAHAIINSGAIVEHFARIGAFTHLSPGVIAACRSEVGEGCFIGTGAIIVPHVSVGEGCIVGAGSLVLHKLPPFTRAWGHPAKSQAESPLL